MRDERKTVKSRWELDSEDILQAIRKKPKNEQKEEAKNGNGKKEGISSGRYTGQ